MTAGSPRPPAKGGVSLTAKWSLSLVAMSVAPVAALALFGVKTERRGLERAEKELEIAAVDETTKELGRALDSAEATAHAVGLALTDPRIATDEGRIALAEDAVARGDDATTAVAICAADGSFVDAVKKVDAVVAVHPCELPADGKKDLESEKAGGFWSVLPRAAAVDLVYVEPLTQAGARTGYVSLEIPAGALSARVASLSVDRFGQADRIAVIGDGGRLLFGSYPRELGGDFERVAHTLHLTREAFGKELALTTEIEEARMVASVRTIPSRRWAVVVLRPEAEAFGALHDVERAFGVGLVLVALAAALVGVRLARATTRPVLALRDLTRAYAKREFEKKSEVKTGDELEALGRAMEDMATELAGSEREIARRTRVEADFARYLPAEVATAVARGDAPLALGGERRHATALFADVVAFTPFAENASPDRVVVFLNELFTVLSEVVFRHGGMVDKFMGDCIMALFGASGGAGHEESAVAAAEDMHRFVETSAADWKARFGFDVRLGIGVASGDVLLGNLGSEKRMEYTAIGDAVNVASRLETLARPGQTLVTRAVAECTEKGFSFRSLGKHPVRGKKEELELFELLE